MSERVYGMLRSRDCDFVERVRRSSTHRTGPHTRRSFAFALIALAIAFAITPEVASARIVQSDTSYIEQIPGTLVKFEMMPVPGGTVQLTTAAGTRTLEVEPFYMAKTETAWDLYDVYVFGLDKAVGGDVDAVARPTRPYVLPGEEFGHEGRPAIGMSFHAATEFTRWLSARTGHTYRLATEAEWVHACRLGHEVEAPDRVWHQGNANDRTQPVTASAIDALGMHDVLGNIAEWVNGQDGEPRAMGGAFTDAPDQIHCEAGKTQTPAWNATDPQLPKSRWWLPDAVFVGFRIVREP